MIDLYKCEQLYLPDVAEYERAKNGKIYPAGSTVLQLSATRGQVGFLEKPGGVEAKYVVIFPIAGIDHRYLNYAIQSNVDDFLRVFKEDLNISFRELKHFKVQLHDPDTQRYIAKHLKKLDEQYQEEQKQYDNLVKMKQYLLQNMFV